MTAMRIFAILCIVAAAMTFPLTATAQKQQQQAKRAQVQDEGALRDKCRAEAYGRGMNRSAQIGACMQRAKGR